MASAPDEATLLGGGPAAFDALLVALTSSSSAAAEAAFRRLSTSHPEPLAMHLASSLAAFATPADLRATAGMLLHKLLLSPPPSSSNRAPPSSSNSAPPPLWPQLSPSVQSALKAHLLSALESDPPKPIAKQVCNTISELAVSLLPENAWAELLPFLLRAAKGPESPNLHESALLIFARLAGYIALDHLRDIHDLLSSSLAHSTSFDVRIAALGAAVSLVQCLPTNADREFRKMQDLLPVMIRCSLTDFLDTGQETYAQEALEFLVQLAGAEPRFLQRHIVLVVGAMMQVAEAAQREDRTRRLAVEFVITLAEAQARAPAVMRRLSQFVGRLFAVLMQMLLDVEDDPAWHSAETEDADAGEGNNYGVAQECLDRLAIAIGGYVIVRVALELIPEYLSTPEWQKHHAALITLARIAKGCAKVMLKNLDKVISMVCSGFQHSHPRVRWAAINAAGQLSADLGPDFQVHYHQNVLTALTYAMDDSQNPRIQAHAVSAFLNFSKNCAPEILTPYMDGLVAKLLALRQNGKQMVQEGALKALAIVKELSQVKKHRAEWSHYDTAVFSNICVEEIEANRMLPGLWPEEDIVDSIRKKLLSRTGRDYDNKQLWHKWKNLNLRRLCKNTEPQLTEVDDVRSKDSGKDKMILSECFDTELSDGDITSGHQFKQDPPHVNQEDAIRMNDLLLLRKEIEYLRIELKQVRDVRSIAQGTYTEVKEENKNLKEQLAAAFQGHEVAMTFYKEENKNLKEQLAVALKGQEVAMTFYKEENKNLKEQLAVALQEQEVAMTFYKKQKERACQLEVELVKAEEMQSQMHNTIRACFDPIWAELFGSTMEFESQNPTDSSEAHG